jgi:hypothetical protein
MENNNELHLTEIKEFMDEKNLTFFGMLSNFKCKDSQFKRDLVLFAKFDDNKNNILEVFNKSLNSNLTIEETLSTNGNLNYCVYNIIDSNLTRKYWQPVIENFLTNNIN